MLGLDFAWAFQDTAEKARDRMSISRVINLCVSESDCEYLGTYVVESTTVEGVSLSIRLFGYLVVRLYLVLRTGVNDIVA